MTMRIKQVLLTGVLAVTMLPPSPALATRVMDIDAENLARGAGFMKDMLALTPNQQTLWQQVAAKSALVLRARQLRRDKAQTSLKAQLQDPAQELRNMSAVIEAEAALSVKENSELRELWLTVNDVLTDQQRLAVRQFLVTQLDRVDAPEHAPGAGRGEGRGEGRGAGRGAGRGEGRGEGQPGGQRHQKPGGEMGGRSRF